MDDGNSGSRLKVGYDRGMVYSVACVGPVLLAEISSVDFSGHPSRGVPIRMEVDPAPQSLLEIHLLETQYPIRAFTICLFRQ